MTNPLPPIATSMESASEIIVGRELTADERQKFIQLRNRYNYDDSDPIVALLDIVGCFTVLVNELPEKLKKASEEMTEKHRLALRDQTIYAAKDIVGVVASQIHMAGRTRKARFVDAAIGGLFGVAFTLVIGIGLYFFRAH